MDQKLLDRLTEVHGAPRAKLIAAKCSAGQDMHTAAAEVTGKSRPECKLMFESYAGRGRYNLEE